MVDSTSVGLENQRDIRVFQKVNEIGRETLRRPQVTLDRLNISIKKAFRTLVVVHFFHNSGKITLKNLVLQPN